MRFSAGITDSDAATCDRLALANNTPSAISAASATIRLRNAASTIGGMAPMPSKDLILSTKARVSAKGLPTVIPSR